MIKFELVGYRHYSTGIVTRRELLATDGYPVYEPVYISEDLIFGRDNR